MFGSGDQQGRRAVGYLRGVTGVDHPVLGEGGFERGEFLRGGPPPDALVGGDRAAVGGHRHDLVLERAAEPPPPPPRSSQPPLASVLPLEIL